MNNTKFNSIPPSEAFKFTYDNNKIEVYVNTRASKPEYNILEICCSLDIDRKLDHFPFPIPQSSTEPVVSFFTNLAKFSLIKRPSFLIQLKQDIEKALNIKSEDFKNYKIFFDIDLGIGNVHQYYELPGQPPANGEYEEMHLVEVLQGDLYITLKNLFYKPENDRILKEIFKEYENFFISWAVNYATDGRSYAVYSTKHAYEIDIRAKNIIWK